MKQRGFTLIELMVAIILLIACIGLIASGIAGINGYNTNSISIGINGVMETRCVEGYKFVIDQDGRTRQILDEFGKGVRCQLNPDPGKMGSFGDLK